MTDYQTPYVIFSRVVPTAPNSIAVGPPSKIYVALNLLDHTKIGIAWSRQEALDIMAQKTKEEQVV